VRVCVSTVGQWHHFDLARQLQRRGHLERLYTGYPRFKVRGVRPGAVQTFPYLVSVEMMLHRFGYTELAQRLSWRSHETFDRWVAAKLTPCDLLVCNESNGLRSYETARRQGARAVCDCGIAHVEYTRRILREEYERWGFHFASGNGRMRAIKLAEYEQADLITIPSSFVQRTFLEQGIAPSKLAKIPYGVELALFHPEPKQDDVFRVLFVGYAGIRKGFPYLVEAFAGLNLPKFELTLIGGLTTEAKSILAKHAGRLQYREVGFVPRPQLRHYYSQGSVLVLPSLIEGMAYVMAQAMACGLPVVATPNTGAEDLFTDGVEGYIVRPRDPLALRERVLHLYENPQVQAEMAAAALKRVQSRGGWDEYGDRVVEVYSALCQAGPQSGIFDRRAPSSGRGAAPSA